MKIALVSNHFWPVTGGIERVMLDVGSEMVRRGHEVEVHCSNVHPNGKKLAGEEEYAGIKIYRYPYAFRAGYYTSLFRPTIKDVDVLHLNGFGMLTNDYLTRKYHRKIPIVFSTMHGIYIPTKKLINKIYHRMYFHTVGKKTLMLADKITTLQELDILRLKSIGIPEGKIVAVPPFLADKMLEERVTVENKPFERYIVYVGRLHTEKSPGHLILALNKLKLKDVGIVFVGPDGGEKEKLSALAERMNMRERVKFTGNVDEYTKMKLIAGSEFLVLPSMYEGFGIVILEAWACSKAVIASRVGGVPYIITDGADGLLYEWGDIDALAHQMESLLADRDLAHKMGISGREKVIAKYTKSVVVSQIENIYEEVIHSNQHGKKS